jgi:tetratricopeptide (TPR) repeat protein
MPELKVKYKFSLILLGVILAFVLLECALGLLSFICSKIYLPEFKPVRPADEAAVIVCLGDSFTYGLGAGYKNSYPVQLEDILNKKAGRGKFKVFNLGIPGSNSSMVVSRLEESIKKFKPDLVIVAIGANDTWNKTEVGLNAEIQHIKSKMFMAKLRSFNLVKLIWINLRQKMSVFLPREKMIWRDKQRFADTSAEKTEWSEVAVYKFTARDSRSYELIKKGNDFRSQSDFERAKACYLQVLENDADNPKGILELSRCYKLAGEYGKAIDLLGRAIRSGREDPQLFAELDDIFILLGNLQKAVNFYSALLKEMPENLRIKKQLSKAYVDLGNWLIRENDIFAAEDCFVKALEYDVSREQALRKLLETAAFYAEKYSLAKAVDCLNRLLKIIPDDARIYADLAYLYGAQNKTTKMFFCYSRMANLPADKRSKDFSPAALLARDLDNALLFANLVKIIRICRREKITLMFSSYPRKLPLPLISAAREYDIPLVDQRQAFADLPAGEMDSKYFISPTDRHCTRQGYRVMAENIAAEVLKIWAKREH